MANPSTSQQRQENILVITDKTISSERNSTAYLPSTGIKLQIRFTVAFTTCLLIISTEIIMILC